jgi:hypothetical protein
MTIALRRMTAGGWNPSVSGWIPPALNQNAVTRVLLQNGFKAGSISGGMLPRPLVAVE